MNKQEFNGLIGELQEYFPRMPINDQWTSLWWKALRNFPKEIVYQVISSYCLNNSIAPTVAKIANEARIACNSRSKPITTLPTDVDEDRPAIKRFRKVSRIEFCMDVLGVDTVTEEIKKLGLSEKSSWADLLANPSWRPRYKEKLLEMFETARTFDPVQYEQRFIYKGFLLPFDIDPLGEMEKIDRVVDRGHSFTSKSAQG